ncbi:MAG TPA: hypothetical protein DDZ51_16165 [Planctomycetaceae bacterium]|nr:hypothetical protein [Planctomycetaceae bacterium]
MANHTGPINANGRAFGPAESFLADVPGRWPGLGKPLALWAARTREHSFGVGEFHGSGARFRVTLPKKMGRQACKPKIDSLKPLGDQLWNPQ